MNIINFIKNLFRSPEVNKNSNIILASNIVKMPSRSDYKNNKDELNLINQYKDDYKQILNSNRYLSSIDFKNDIVFNDMKMYIDLCLSTFNMDYSFTDMTLEDKFDHLVKIYKMKIYLYNIIKLEKETRLKLVALKELYDNKIFLSKNKKNSILNEINYLTNALVVYENSKLSIFLQINNYINNDIYNFSSSELDDTKELLENKKIIIEKIYASLFNQNIDIKDIEELAHAEENIEVYVYKYKKVDKLKDELYNFEVDTFNKEELLKDIEKIEYKLLAFYLYGKDIINETDLYTLYEIKFQINALPTSILDFNDVFVTNDTFYKELDCYMKIVEKKINSLSNDLENLFIDEANKRYINVIKGILKNGKRYFDYYEILTNKYLLNILLCMKNRDKIIYILNNFKVKKSDFPLVNFYEDIFVWDEEIPIKSIYKIMSYQNYKLESEIYDSFKEALYDTSKHLYCFPEGIKEINDYKTNKAFFNKIKKDMERKTIILPSSLKEIHGTLFEAVSVDTIQFNDGLEVIGKKVFETQSFDHFCLPASIKKIEDDSFDYDEIDNLYITNCSHINYDIYNILKHFLDIEVAKTSVQDNIVYNQFTVDLCLSELHILSKDSQMYTITEDEMTYDTWATSKDTVIDGVIARINGILEINKNKSDNEYTRLLEPMREIFKSKGINYAISSCYDKGKFYVGIKQEEVSSLNKNIIMKISSIYNDRFFYSNSMINPDNLDAICYVCSPDKTSEDWQEKLFEKKKYVVLEFDINDKFIILGTTIMLANILQDQTNYHYNTEFHLRVTLDNNSYLQESLYYPVSKEFNITDIYHYEIDKTVSLKFVLDKENLHEEILKYFDAYEKDNQNILTLKDKFYNSLSN